MKYLFGDHQLDTQRRELRQADVPIALEPQVFDLLVYLVRNRDRVVSKHDLLASVWGGRIVADTTIDSRIQAARRAVGDSGAEQRLIRTFNRKGVRFIGSVEEKYPDPLRASSTVSASDKPSIAVLPFKNLSSNPEQEFFADGIAEDIIIALSR